MIRLAGAVAMASEAFLRLEDYVGGPGVVPLPDNHGGRIIRNVTDRVRRSAGKIGFSSAKLSSIPLEIWLEGGGEIAAAEEMGRDLAVMIGARVAVRYGVKKDLLFFCETRP